MTTVSSSSARYPGLALRPSASETSDVKAVTVELVRGKDRKLYPVGLPRPAKEHLRLVGLSHTLRCGRKLSYPKIRDTLAAEFGVRRSVGAIYRDLHAYTCPHCAPQPPEPAPRPVRPEVHTWR